MTVDLQDIPLPPAYRDLLNQKILVTGAAGFIGGHLFRRLTHFGLNVVGTVLHPEESEALQQQGYQIEVLDLSDSGSWQSLVEGFDIVFNIAAMFQEVEYSKDEFEQVNRHGALKLAKAAAAAGVKRFVHCSTVGVHGHVKEVPATEQTPYNPMDIYHETKLAGELDILAFARQLPIDGMAIVVNRPAMVYGPYDMRMLKLFKSILSGQFRMIGSGKTLAHLGYIEDQTESFLLCALAPRDKVHAESFNIASGNPLTLNELAQTIAEVGGVRLAKLHIPLAPVWLASLLCELACKPFNIKPPLFRRRVGFFTHDRAFDLSKAEQQLGYVSHWGHREGIAKTIQWYREKQLVPE